MMKIEPRTPVPVISMGLKLKRSISWAAGAQDRRNLKQCHVNQLILFIKSQCHIASQISRFKTCRILLVLLPDRNYTENDTVPNRGNVPVRVVKW